MTIQDGQNGDTFRPLGYLSVVKLFFFSIKVAYLPGSITCSIAMHAY